MIQQPVRILTLWILLAGGLNAHAQTTYNWTNAAGGSYHTAGNWSPGGGPPTLIDHSIFNLNNSYTVTFANAPTLGGDFHVRNGNVTFSNLNPTAFVNWHSASTSLVGPAAGDAQVSATLNLTNLGSNPMRGSDLKVGYAAGKVGTMNINNAQWIAYLDDGVTFVGEKGTGNLNITTTGTLQNSLLQSNSIIVGYQGGTGNVLVSGVNASLISQYGVSVGVGANSVGSLTVSNGGKVQSGNSLYVGHSSQGNNLVTVDGAGSELSSGSDGLYVTFGAAKGTLQVTGGGKVTSFGDVHIGEATNSTGVLNVSGAGSQLIATGQFDDLFVGEAGTGTINISNGGTVTADKLFVDRKGNGLSSVNLDNGTMNLSGSVAIGVTGNGSLSLTNGSMLNSAGQIALGQLTGGKGTLSVLGGSQLTSDAGAVGLGIAGSKATISGAGSKWMMSNSLAAGFSSTAEIVVQDQGQIISKGGSLGAGSTGLGIATISGNGSNWTNTTAGQGDVFSVGRASEGILTINTGGSMTSDFASIGAFASGLGNVSITDSGSKWNVSNLLLVGDDGTGNLLISNAGQLVTGTAASVKLGYDAGSNGKLTVTGNGSNVQFAAGGSLTVGNSGSGILEVSSGGSVIGGDAIIGNLVGSNGLATVKNAGSNWAAGGSLIVGQVSSGELRIENGGSVSAQTIDVAVGLNSTGNISLSGSNSTLAATQTMRVGGISEGGQGSLTINNGTTATVGGALTLYSQGSVHIQGGTLQLGSLNDQNGSLDWQSGTVRFSNNTVLNNALLDKLVGAGHTIGNGKSLEGTAGTTLVVGPTNFTVNGGKVAGNNLTNIGVTSVEAGRIDMTGVLLNDVQGTFVLQNAGLTTFTSGVTNNGTFLMTGPATRSIGGTFSNNGTLAGSGTLRHTLQNNGTIQIGSADRLVVENGSNPSVNNGTVQLGGGRLEFTGKLTNAPGSFISGNGTLATSSGTPGSQGLSNRGSIVFTSGANHLFGDFQNESGGMLVTSGGATTTFHDDVVHNGTEIRTSGDSRSVFLGSVLGAGQYTGSGGVYFEGDLRPGNSPASVFFGGDVFFSATAGLEIELGGLLAGLEYDQLAIAGLASLDGLLSVHTIGGFNPEAGDQFTIIDNSGTDMVLGRFIGLNEGSQFWSNGNSWQISYVGGTGNDVVLRALVSVPEPGCAMLLILAATTGMSLRRKQR